MRLDNERTIWNQQAMQASKVETTKRASGWRAIRESAPLGLRSYSATHFLAALGLLIFTAPFVDRPPYGETIEGVVMSLVFLSGTLAIGGKRSTLATALAFCIPALIAKWLSHFLPGLVPGTIVPVCTLLFLAYLLFHLIRYIILAPRVNHEVVSTAIASYVLMGFVWTFAYIVISRLSPNAFIVQGQPVESIDPFEAFYFSFITLISIGYGDITPVSRVAQMLAVLEGMTGMFFVVILISRLVSLYSSGDRAGNMAKEVEVR